MLKKVKALHWPAVLGIPLLLVLLSACVSVDTRHSEYHIGQFTAPEKAYSSNSFWIEGPLGVVLVGTQFLPSAAIAALEAAEEATGKKVLLAIVLQATPDQFNGVQALTARGIKVVSASQVVAQISAAHHRTWGVFYPRRKPDYPDALVLPEAAWDQTIEFEAAGLAFTAHVFDDASNQSQLVIELDKHLFVGNLVVNQAHIWPPGMTEQNLSRLDKLRLLAARVIHPGRGRAAPADVLLNQQVGYLEFVQQAVADSHSGGVMTDQDKQAIIARIVTQYPDYAFQRFLRYVVPTEWERQLMQHP